MYFSLVPSSKNVLDRCSSTFQSKVKIQGQRFGMISLIFLMMGHTQLKILSDIKPHLIVTAKFTHLYSCYFRKFNVRIVQWNFQWKLYWNFIESKNMEPKPKCVQYVVRQFMAGWICTWSQCTTRRKSFNVINVIIG